MKSWIVILLQTSRFYRPVPGTALSFWHCYQFFTGLLSRPYKFDTTFRIPELPTRKCILLDWTKCWTAPSDETEVTVIKPTSILVSMQSKGYVCSRCIAGIAGSNPAEGMNVRLLSAVCCVSCGDQLFIGLEESYRLIVSVCDLGTSTMRRPTLTRVVAPQQRQEVHTTAILNRRSRSTGDRTE